MYLTLTDLILLTSIIQALSLATFLLLPPNNRLVSNQLLVATLVFFAAGLGEIFLYSSGLALAHPNLAYLGTLIGLLQAGTLFLYTRALMYQDFRLRKEHLVHTLLFWVVGAIFLIEYYLQPTGEKLRILNERDHPGVLTSPLLAVAIHAVFLGYLYATIRTINRFGLSLRQVFSSIENKQLSWLRLLLIGYAIAWTVSMFYCMTAHVFKSAPGADWVAGAGAVTGFLFINFLMVNALRQPVIFTGLAADQAALLDDTTVPEFDQHLKQKLAQFMAEDKPYLYSNLTLEQLAQKVGAHPREVSRAINQGFGCNFFEFVSSYRVQEAKRRLADPSDTSSILQVMYDSGFNSKSVFNTAFKNNTGLTPSDFRRMHTRNDNNRTQPSS
ncbi:MULTISPECIES: helix-turn-helix domain-containing protein [Pseudomonadota]|uniref:helix-turn-helix domain-containing protein n=1 Tax=Pseudomonadota TaxID=1224 RepID=UPI0008EF57B6|nr:MULTISPECIES: helix-turn-helix domain-containing protein [Pseudomonadota]PHS46706.1 MAG: AraC family transcriptional regulator [Marinobacter sp.]PTB94090.1 AraC family transcriptional regulator [Marinobacter sp. B9-2]SFE38955.1 AraC-type DNA-binding protein [Marinobacter sp. DSM 26671]